MPCNGPHAWFNNDWILQKSCKDVQQTWDPQQRQTCPVQSWGISHLSGAFDATFLHTEIFKKINQTNDNISQNLI